MSVFSSTKNNPKGHAFATLKKKGKLKIPLKLKYHYVKTCWKQLKTVKSSIKFWNTTGLLFYLRFLADIDIRLYKGTRSALIIGYSSTLANFSPMSPKLVHTYLHIVKVLLMLCNRLRADSFAMKADENSQFNHPDMSLSESYNSIKIKPRQLSSTLQLWSVCQRQETEISNLISDLHCLQSTLPVLCQNILVLHYLRNEFFI